MEGPIVPIKIIKKGAANIPEAAPIVTDREPPKTAPTPEERKVWWSENVPPPGAKPKECAYCHQFYLMPCNEEQHKSCANWFHLQANPKKAETAS